VSTNLTVEGNVIHDWRSTNSQSMGLSIPCEHGQNTRIINNYINGNLAPGQSWVPAQGRLPAIGTMIEVGGETNLVSGNVTGGTYWFNIGAGGVHAPPRYTNVIEGNTFYGSSSHGQPHIVSWPNSIGPSSWSEGTGNTRAAASQMPAPDAWIRKIAEVSGQTPPPTAPPPTLSSGQLLFNTSPHQLQLVFSQNVGSSFSTSDLTVKNLETGQIIPTQIVSSSGGQTFTLRFGTNVTLPDGNYSATIAAGAVSGSGGASNAAPMSVNFFFLRGDANRDRTVNGADATVLIGNIGRAGDFSQGDFNYDGKVTLRDYNVLAASIGRSLPQTNSILPGAHPVGDDPNDLEMLMAA
jgi:hypothetical protein